RSRRWSSSRCRGTAGKKCCWSTTAAGTTGAGPRWRDRRNARDARRRARPLVPWSRWSDRHRIGLGRTWTPARYIARMQYTRAVLLVHAKEVRDDGSIVEIVIWELPAPLTPCRHRFKYRLYFGAAGECRVRYDNE